MFGQRLDPLIADARMAMATGTRCQICGVLDAERHAAVLDAVKAVPRWTLVTRLGGRHVDLDADGMAKLLAAQQAEFHRRVRAEAELGFQYLYETYPLYDIWHRGRLREEAPLLCDLFERINSPAFLDPMREVLDRPDIAFADGQLTRYRGGHFLTTHDDGVEGKNRIAAYVLTLSPEWREEWGGVLEFYDDAGAACGRFVPRGNTLSLFQVPQPHAVSEVRPDIEGERISITGWLRAGEDPGP